MELPIQSRKAVRIKNKTNKVPIVLSTIALILGIVSVSISGYMYLSQPKRIHDYVQQHKEELKGAKGDKGDSGPRGQRGLSGINGSNSYAPTHCSTYGYGSYASTNCY